MDFDFTRRQRRLCGQGRLGPRFSCGLPQSSNASASCLSANPRDLGDAGGWLPVGDGA
jgi:hypothetical protein